MEENYEIIYTCRSTNNKNVRANELNVLEKRPEELYFIFGENEVNTKKRYYADLKTLNEDFEELKKIKQEMKSHKDLIVWQKSMEHVSAIYVATRAFPQEELFGIVSQLRRAAVSIPSNIAEGYGIMKYSNLIFEGELIGKKELE